MTTVVLFKDGIYADCRLTLKVKARDMSDRQVEVKGLTDEYTKIGRPALSQYGETIEAVAVFGEIETAEALIQYVLANGMDVLEKSLHALIRFNPNLPKIDSGFAWVSQNSFNWIILNRQGFEIKTKPFSTDEHENVVALGSGKDHFDIHYSASKDVYEAFCYTLCKDEQSSTLTYDVWKRETDVIQRFTLLHNEALPTVEELVRGQQG